MTLDISIDNKQLPYLAQAWIENENQEKIITGPLLPPLRFSALSRVRKAWSG
ncbi:chaperone protein PapD [Escherichia coli]|uniref:Chaperone protein PapD n=1 Tax=Escherichia coli TaxID=562 RepID=A0A484YSR7_ECOLX|nr:chaperone protein PapD [Escherichia coli]